MYIKILRVVFPIILVLSTMAIGKRQRHRRWSLIRCKEPDPSLLPTLSSLRLRFTFFPLPSMQQMNFTTVPVEYKHLNYIQLGGPTRCPKQETNQKFDGRSKDLCPEHYVLNMDKNRIPRYFYEATCSCKTPPNLPAAIDCEDRIMYSRVLRRTGCVKRVYVYSEIWEPIRIGCVAKKAPIRLSSPESPKSLQKRAIRQM